MFFTVKNLLYCVIFVFSVVFANHEGEYSTTSVSVPSGHTHRPLTLIRRPTHFHALYSAFASVVGLVCVAIITLIAILRYRRQRMLMDVVARRYGSRRLISTYPWFRSSSSGGGGGGGGGGVVAAATAVTLPPPYSEAVAAPPPYSTIDRSRPVSADPRANVDSTAVELRQQSTHETENLLNQQT